MTAMTALSISRFTRPSLALKNSKLASASVVHTLFNTSSVTYSCIIGLTPPSRPEFAPGLAPLPDIDASTCRRDDGVDPPTPGY
jgi:hypothetical protein